MDGALPTPANQCTRWFDQCAFVCIATHIIVWTIVPTLLNHNLPLDVIEALAWGHEWEWGYDKHPPLSAWAAEVSTLGGGGWDLPVYLMSQLCIGVGFWGIYRLGKRLFGPASGLLSMLALEGVFYLNFTSPELNVNVVQVPFWAWAFESFWLGVQTGRLRWWALLGVCTGAALLGKYLAVFLAVPLIAFLLLNPAGRAAWRTAGPYLALGVALAVFAPHLVWAAEHGWGTIFYGLKRAGGGGPRPWTDHVTNPLSFLLAVVFNCGLMSVITASVWRSLEYQASWDDRKRYAFWIAFSPLAAMLVLSLIKGLELRSMWAAPMLVAVTLPIGAAFSGLEAGLTYWRRPLTASLIALVIPVIAYVGEWAGTESVTGHHRRCDYPGRELASQVTALWHARFHKPAPYVIGSEWLAGNIGWYSPDRPSVFIWRKGPQSLDIDRTQIQQHGAIVIWSRSNRKGQPIAESEQERQAIRELFGSLEGPTMITLRDRSGAPSAVVEVAWVTPQRAASTRSVASNTPPFPTSRQ